MQFHAVQITLADMPEQRNVLKCYCDKHMNSEENIHSDKTSMCHYFVIPAKTTLSALHSEFGHIPAFQGLVLAFSSAFLSLPQWKLFFSLENSKLDLLNNICIYIYIQGVLFNDQESTKAHKGSELIWNRF